MKIKVKNQFKSLQSNFEIVCIVSIVALVGDFVWLIHDIIANSLNIHYLITGTALLVGIIGTAFVLIRHNRVSTYWLNKETLKQKLQIAKAKRRHFIQHM